MKNEPKPLSLTIKLKLSTKTTQDAMIIQNSEILKTSLKKSQKQGQPIKTNYQIRISLKKKRNKCKEIKKKYQGLEASLNNFFWLIQHAPITLARFMASFFKLINKFCEFD